MSGATFVRTDATFVRTDAASKVTCLLECLQNLISPLNSHPLRNVTLPNAREIYLKVRTSNNIIVPRARSASGINQEQSVYS